MFHSKKDLKGLVWSSLDPFSSFSRITAVQFSADNTVTLELNRQCAHVWFHDYPLPEMQCFCISCLFHKDKSQGHLVLDRECV